MKLYSDEESDYICRDSRAVPLALRDQVFNLIMDDDHVSLFNPLGYQKRTYHTPTNVNLYSEAVSLQMGIEPAGFINEYNKRYDVWYKAMQDREDRANREYKIGYGMFSDTLADCDNVCKVLKRCKTEVSMCRLGKEAPYKSDGQNPRRERQARSARKQAVDIAASSTIAHR